MFLRRGSMVVLTLVLTAPACSDDDSGGSSGDTGGDTGGDTAPDSGSDSNPDATSDANPDTTADANPDAGGLPTAAELQDGWNILEPGGDTICSRGTPYLFTVRKGTINRVVVDFMGGGACWDELTCSFAGAIFNEDVVGIRDLVESDLDGIYDAANGDNPFADYWHVFVPYCTGDVHWGNATTTYAEGTADEVTIEHRGAVNARAVLDWVGANFASPEQIVVTGCSAGAYGSIMWAPHLIQMYPEADVVHFADSGAGVITDDFFFDSFPSWNAEGSFPSWIPALDPEVNDIFQMDLADLYVGIANHYSDYTFSQYNTYLDENQTFYFEAMGGGGAEAWSARMQALIVDIQGRATNFRSYTAPGEQHCIIGFDNFYTVDSDGVELLDWVNDLVAGSPVDNVLCTDCERTTGE